MKPLKFQVFSRFAGDLRRALAERFDRERIESVESLTRFARTRAAYVAQTSMFGYLKTRMGTSFQRHFEDDEFSGVIRDSAMRLFASCLADLTVFAVATTADRGRLDDAQAAALARLCYRDALTHEAGAANPALDIADALSRFGTRANLTIWPAALAGEAAFAGSAADLIRFAPVADEFKALDRKIVTNSIRFRWRDIREQFRKRADGAAIRDDWVRRSAA